MSAATIELRILREEYLQEAKEILVDGFCDRNPIHKCLNESREAFGAMLSENFVRQCAGDGLSVVAVDTANGGKIAGVSLVSLTSYSIPEEIQTQPYKVYKKMANQLRSIAASLVTDKFQSQRSAGLELVAVCEEHSQRGICSNMIKKQIEILKERNIQLLVGDFTNEYSRKAALKLGFEMVASVKYADFEYEGQKPFLSIAIAIAEEHKQVSLGLLKVDI